MIIISCIACTWRGMPSANSRDIRTSNEMWLNCYKSGKVQIKHACTVSPTACHRKTASCHVTKPSMCFYNHYHFYFAKQLFITIPLTNNVFSILFFITKILLLLRLHRHILLLLPPLTALR